ncbi:MAG: hypothetical protein N3E45_09785 [Oscillatoriaceae bacterium SKW80]|nr:hypothetical protein [Oscillatoriaceae bacterium SKYG93]MCX8121105.1 hypothetical protein [Oscillatoriaceae bacterium SKW80]MDW8453565.1 hypothetical protein [Oscillatoriaceae cyanobacterium SKYGB_i_bin93]HIK26916.1 hypothetical protein [Oscillatoriaceae cyanobacterium M7585_C2015_266]
MTSKVYTTQDLINILAQERSACLKGERLKLAATPCTGNPALDKFLKPDGLQKFAAYQDFKAAVHRYQLEHQVSGIVWRQISVKGHTLLVPQVDDQLIALPKDIKILKEAKAEILAFWEKVTVGMDLYLSVNNGKDYRLLEPTDVPAIASRTEWATLWKWEKSHFLEIVLQLGWGKVEEAAYRRGWPNHGSEYVHAVNPGKRPICS